MRLSLEDGSARERATRYATALVPLDGVTRGEFLRQGMVATLALSGSGVLLSACGGSSEPSGGAAASGSPPKSPKGVMVWGMLNEPASLDPARALGPTDFLVSQAVCDPLVGRDPGNATRLRPALAASWEVSDDAREWIGKLRPGTKFHDGSELDSSAVRESIEYWAGAPGTSASLGLKALSVDDSDPSVVRIVSKQPFPDLSRNLTLVSILSPKQMRGGTKAFAKGAVGTGAFIFGSRSRGEISLERNPAWWGDGPYVERLTVKVIPDLAARLSALQTGQVNVVSGVPTLQAQSVDRSPRAKISRGPLWRNSLLIFKTATAPTDQLAVRQAAALGLDRNAIAKAGIADGKPADAILPPGVYGYRPMDPQYGFDPERARSLLRQVNGGKPINLRMATLSGDYSGLTTNLAEAMAGQLKEVGLNVDMDIVEPARFNEITGDPKSPYHLVFTAWSYLTAVPSNLLAGPTLKSFAGVDEGLDRSTVEQIDSLIAKIASTPDSPEREQAVGDLQDLYARQLAVAPLFTLEGIDAHSESLERFKVPPDSLTYQAANMYFSS